MNLDSESELLQPDPQQFVVVNINISNASENQAVAICHQATEIINQCFERAHALGFWMTKDFRLIPYEELEMRHMLNILDMLKKKYLSMARATYSQYVSGPTPQGEMAQEAFEKEAEWWEANWDGQGWALLAKEHEVGLKKLLKAAKKLHINIDEWKV